MRQMFYLLLIFLHSTVYGQYKIDLSSIKTPTITYYKLGNEGKKGDLIRINNLYLERNNKPVIPVMGEFHYNRVNQEYWKDVLLKMKATGVNIVSTYVLWNLHEEIEGKQNWKDNNNLHKFLLQCKEYDLKVHLRIGPYCNAEIRNGGLPDWLKAKQLKCRTNDPQYLNYVRNWYQSIFEQIDGLLHKNGGPIFAIQLENEYVTQGMVISHLTKLKRIAQKIGFDVPLYTMTHWMSSNYPKGELIPYAGYYIETPWAANGKEELESSDFEFYTYKRISDNIGTDIIQQHGELESLRTKNDSPYFTCEVGIGTTSFYQRRAIIPDKMAGENCILRLGSGVNLMGYYMYAGGSNPIGKLTTMESSGPQISYDYQAPIKEFGTMGSVMKETKKFNYFMNDFGTRLAPLVAFLPKSNKKRENLQWAIRTDGEKGFLFCSNYLYKHKRPNYKQIQFEIKTNKEELKIPTKKLTIPTGSYFIWPFNLELETVTIKQATLQPLCRLKEEKLTSYFFFQNKNIPGEYLLKKKNIKNLVVQNGKLKKQENTFLIHNLKAGKKCIIHITMNNGKKIKIITLTEKEATNIWKGKRNNKPFIAFSKSWVLSNKKNIVLKDEKNKQKIELYQQGKYYHYKEKEKQIKMNYQLDKIGPFHSANWITTTKGKQIAKIFNLKSLSKPRKVWLRCITNDTCKINNQKIYFKQTENRYQLKEISSLIKKGLNKIEFKSKNRFPEVIATIEVLLENGERHLWKTDNRWTNLRNNQPVRVIKKKKKPKTFSPSEHLILYHLNFTNNLCSKREKRIYTFYKGDIAQAYIGNKLIHDSYYNGKPWILSLNRIKKEQTEPIIIRIKGFESSEVPIYLEKKLNLSECIIPKIEQIKIKTDSEFILKEKSLKRD